MERHGFVGEIERSNAYDGHRVGLWNLMCDRRKLMITDDLSIHARATRGAEVRNGRHVSVGQHGARS